MRHLVKYRSGGSPTNSRKVLANPERDIFTSVAKLATGKFISTSGKGRWEVTQWLFFQAASIGPMLGQLGHFTHYAPEQIPYAIERYSKEGHRLFGILEQRLKDREFICNEYSIVDMAHFGWLYFAVKMGIVNTEKYPNLMNWHDKIVVRPAVIKGLTVPAPYNLN